MFFLPTSLIKSSKIEKFFAEWSTRFILSVGYPVYIIGLRPDALK